MPQDPILADQLRIEPGTAGVRVINRDTVTGGLKFTDPAFPSGLILAQLVGLQALGNCLVVGSGQYTTIQAAIAAVPVTSTADAPTLIFIMPGTYTESLTLSTDGIVIHAFGFVKVVNAVAGPTITIAESPTGIPRSVRLQALTVENADAGGICIKIDGSTTYADGTITVVTAPLAANDTLTIGGTVLTGIVGTRVSGSDNFSVDPTSVATMAIEIAAAINDVANSFAVTVSAAALNDEVTITSVAAGAGGNAITLAVSTTPAGGLTLSGATLTGGGTSGSEVGADGIDLVLCTLIASGAAGIQIDADTVNSIVVDGGTWRGSASDSKAVINQCARFAMFGVGWVNDLEFAYDDGNDQPVTLTSEYQVSHCPRVGDLLSNMIGTGSLQVAHCPVVGDIIAGGDTTLTVDHSRIGTVSLDDTLVTTITNTTRGTASVAGGTPTLLEPVFTGSVVFAASLSEAVVLEVPAPDATYAVLVDCPDTTAIPQATVKVDTGFTLTTGVAVTGTVFYTVTRQL